MTSGIHKPTGNHPSNWKGTRRRGMEIGAAGIELLGGVEGGQVNGRAPVDDIGQNLSKMKLALAQAHELGVNVIRSWITDGKYSAWGRGNGDQKAYAQVQIDRVKNMIEVAKAEHYDFKFEITLDFGRGVSTHDAG